MKKYHMVIMICFVLLFGRSHLLYAEEDVDSFQYIDTVVISQQVLTPEVRPIWLNGEIFVPLRWSFKQMGAEEIVWTPLDSAEAAGLITCRIADYFQLLQYDSLLQGLAIEEKDLQSPLPPQLHRIAMANTPLVYWEREPLQNRPLILDIGDEQLEIYDYLLVNNQYYLSVGWLNTLFGAKIDIDEEKLSIEPLKRNDLTKQLNDFSRQLVCGESDEVIALWIRACERQSGALQYELLSDALKKESYQMALNLGTWQLSNAKTLSDGQITEKSSDGKQRYLYKLTFCEMIIDQPNKILHQQIVVEKIESSWQITAVKGDTDEITLLPAR